MQGAAHEFIIRENRSPTSYPLISENGHQRVHAIIGLQFIRPSSLGRAMAQAGRSDLGNSQELNLTPEYI
jgi:hypothetical protein